VLAALAPTEPEVHGLLALMELHASRLPARVDGEGQPVLLADQDRRQWDHLLLRRGLASLDHAQSLDAPIGPYTVQAGIAACHARASTAGDTDWSNISYLYGVLSTLWPTPVVELNRAVAVGMAGDPDAALEIVDVLGSSGALDDYPQLWAVRGDLLVRLGRGAEAHEAFQQAASLTHNSREQALFLARAAEITA
jgi:predicted RNA polymerase sigma factor